MKKMTRSLYLQKLLLLTNRINTTEFAFMMVIADHYNAVEGVARPGRLTIMSEAKIKNKSSLSSVIESLKKKKFISVTGDGQQANRYAPDFAHIRLSCSKEGLKKLESRDKVKLLVDELFSGSAENGLPIVRKTDQGSPSDVPAVNDRSIVRETYQGSAENGLPIVRKTDQGSPSDVPERPKNVPTQRPSETSQASGGFQPEVGLGSTQLSQPEKKVTVAEYLDKKKVITTSKVRDYFRKPELEELFASVEIAEMHLTPFIPEKRDPSIVAKEYEIHIFKPLETEFHRLPSQAELIKAINCDTFNGLQRTWGNFSSRRNSTILITEIRKAMNATKLVKQLERDDFKQLQSFSETRRDNILSEKQDNNDNHAPAAPLDNADHFHVALASQVERMTKETPKEAAPTQKPFASVKKPARYDTSTIQEALRMKGPRIVNTNMTSPPPTENNHDLTTIPVIAERDVQLEHHNPLILLPPTNFLHRTSRW